MLCHLVTREPFNDSSSPFILHVLTLMYRTTSNLAVTNDKYRGTNEGPTPVYLRYAAVPKLLYHMQVVF